MKCSKCGVEYDDSFKFCPECGEAKSAVTTPAEKPPVPESISPLPEAPESATTLIEQNKVSTQEKKSPRFSRKTKVIAGVAVVIIVGLVIGLTVGLGGGSKSGTTSETTTTETTTQSNETFTNSNWKEVCSDPSSFKGAKVNGRKLRLGCLASLDVEKDNQRLLIS